MDIEIFGGIIILFFAVISLASLGFWIWTLIDCVGKDHPSSNDKLIWVLLIVFLGILGSILYLAIQRPKLQAPSFSNRRQRGYGTQGTAHRPHPGHAARRPAPRAGQQSTPNAFEKYKRKQQGEA